MLDRAEMLSVRSVSKTYTGAGGAEPVLRDVSLALGAGASLALTGESGSGKSTLLHLIAGLEPVDSGEIRVGPGIVTALGDLGRARLRREAIGIVFQQFNLIPSLDVGANLAFQARLAGRLDPAWQAELTGRLGLATLLARYPEELSGGQQQRVAIGRALAARPGLILADEPTGNLDEATGDAVLDLLLGLVAATGASLLMVTHSGRPLRGLARRPRHLARRPARMTRAVFAALLGHWRRHPLELATLLLGLAVATALWSGVQALNAQARASYAAAEAVLGGAEVARVEARDGRDFPLADYIALRRAGWKASPVLEGDWRQGETRLRVIGIDPLTLPPGAVGPESGDDAIRAFLLPPGRALTAPETAPLVAATSGLPPPEPLETAPPDTIVTDIGRAEALLGTRGEVSHLLLPAAEAGRPLPADLALRLRIEGPGRESDLARLTDSFHLNLTAFGFLSFVVGLFIVYSAIGLAFEQRRPTLRALRACGVPARVLTLTLLAEMTALALIAGAAGMVAGYGIAAALLPDVAASLRGLYGAAVPGSLSLGLGWWLAGLGMALVGALAASATSLWRAATLSPLAVARPFAWIGARRRALKVELAIAAALATGGLALLALGDGLVAGFAAMGALLLSAALALPAALFGALALGARSARGPVAQWAWADGRQELTGLSLALMALLLALGVNIGVGTMVDSFRETFLGWLDRRLAAELYVTAADSDQARAVAAWLEDQPSVTAVLPIWSARSRLADAPLELYGFRDDPTYRENWPLQSALPGAWDRVAAGGAALASEQLATRLGLRPGDVIEVPAPDGPRRLTIAAIYPDYGNPEGQIMLGLGALAAWPDAERRRMAVRVAPERAAGLAADLRAAFDPPPTVVDQRAIKEVSRGVFDKTFAVTVALNALTLGVAGVALLASLLTLSNQRFARLAPLWALGLTRRHLAGLEMAKALGLAALTAVAALPLGLAVAWVLTAVINPLAFGWRLPILLFPGKWLTLFALALATAGLAAAWPAWRLARAAPTDLLRSFGNER